MSSNSLFVHFDATFKWALYYFIDYFVHNYYAVSFKKILNYFAN